MINISRYNNFQSTVCVKDWIIPFVALFLQVTEFLLVLLTSSTRWLLIVLVPVFGETKERTTLQCNQDLNTNTESSQINSEFEILTFWASLSSCFWLLVLICRCCVDLFRGFFLSFWSILCFGGCIFFLHLYVVLFLSRFCFWNAVGACLFGFLEWSRCLKFLHLFMNSSVRNAK